MPAATHPLNSFATFDGTAIQVDGPRLNMVNVIAGVKGSGKSHLAKHLVLGLSALNIPCIIFDINGEYVELPNAQVLRWGQNYLLDLAEVGPEMLITLVRSFCPLPAGQHQKPSLKIACQLFSLSGSSTVENKSNRSQSLSPTCASKPGVVEITSRMPSPIGYR
jgi:uncharacterized protein DUF87